MITSISNNRIKNLISLAQKSKIRKEQKAFLIEGERLFFDAPINDIKEIYYTEDFLSRCPDRTKLKLKEIKKNNKNILVETVTNDVFKKFSETQTPQGIAAVVGFKESLADEFYSMLPQDPVLLVLENIQDPGNLGTMLRVSEAAGVHGIIMTQDCVDMYNPKVIRSTMGSIFRMKVLVTKDLIEELKVLKKKNITSYAAHLSDSRYYDEYDFTKGCAFLIGNEGNGLKKETADAADFYLKIPMMGMVESLNAAMASGILVYDSLRQRRKTID